MQLELDGVAVHYGGRPVVSDVTLTLPDGDFGCLLGPSGSGKTSLLRAIAGFVDIAAGAIRVGGETLSRPGYSREPAQRGIGMVFQDLALLPHLSVADNIAFGLDRWPRAQRRERVVQMLALTGLQAHADHHPDALSGGQQQRVALARALAPQPRLLLLDEPFSSLDSALRLSLAEQIRAIVAETATTALLVTHDQQEAFALGRHVGVVDQGTLRQWASPYDIYHRPRARSVAEFIGDGVWLPGRVDAEGRVHTELGMLGPLAQAPGSAEVDVLIRPDDILHDDASPLSATICAKAFRGAQILYRLELPSGQALKTLVPSHHNHALGQPLGIRLEMDHLIVFPRSAPPV